MIMIKIIEIMTTRNIMNNIHNNQGYRIAALYKDGMDHKKVNGIVKKLMVL